MTSDDIQFAIITTTKYRDTLPITIKSFDKHFKGCLYHPNDIGVMGAWIYTANFISETNAPYCCVLSDDYVFHDDTLKFLSDVPDRFGYLALFTPKQPGLQDEIKEEGWNRIKVGKGAWGGNYIIPTKLMKKMLNSGLFKELTDGRTTGVDSCVSEWMYQMGKPMYYHNPSVTLHIGVDSTLDHGFVQSYGWSDLEI